jgi:predicted protein tyrosine phosphatase
MIVEEIVELLHARRSGSGWIARCPAHADRSPSLSIHEGDARRVLIHCFGGCSIKAVCTAMGVAVSDLFADVRRTDPEPKIVREAERRIQALRDRLTPRERALPVTVVFCSRENLNAGIARALALTARGEIVWAVLRETK